LNNNNNNIIIIIIIIIIIAPQQHSSVHNAKVVDMRENQGKAMTSQLLI
jgi:hypothetical protein